MDGEWAERDPSPAFEPVDTAPAIDARFRARSAWLARTERDLVAARITAEAGCPDWEALVKQLQAMLDAAADATCLTSLDRERLAGQARGLARTAYRRGVEEVLDRSEETGRSGEEAVQREVLLGKAERLMHKLKRLKLDPAPYDALTARLARLRSGGEKPTAQPAPPRALAGERRLFPRYREPQLTVQLGTHYCRTANWSLGGLLLLCTPAKQAEAGASIALAAWIAGGHRYEDQALVIRRDAQSGLALKLRRFGSHLVDLKQECERRRMPPRC